VIPSSLSYQWVLIFRGLDNNVLYIRENDKKIIIVTIKCNNNIVDFLMESSF
jgi:hypothetical protein